MKKYVCSLIIISLICIGESLLAAEAEKNSWGEYCFSELTLSYSTTGWTWGIKLYNEMNLVDQLKKYKPHRVRWGTACTITGKPRVKATLFLEGICDDQVVIYSDFFAYDPRYKNKFPVIIRLDKLGKTFVVLSPCKPIKFP